MKITFKKINGFSQGILYQLLVDAYSFDERWKARFDKDWVEFDNFFFDNPDIADGCGFVTMLDDIPIGHISWDPRKCPEYVQLGHNCIATKYKGNGYGKMQLQEAVYRIRQINELKKIIVVTNSSLIAKYNYESVGFKLYTRQKNEDDTFSGDYLQYQLAL